MEFLLVSGQIENGLCLLVSLLVSIFRPLSI